MKQLFNNLDDLLCASRRLECWNCFKKCSGLEFYIVSYFFYENICVFSSFKFFSSPSYSFLYSEFFDHDIVPTSKFVFSRLEIVVHLSCFFPSIFFSLLIHPLLFIIDIYYSLCTNYFLPYFSSVLFFMLLSVLSIFCLLHI